MNYVVFFKKPSLSDQQTGSFLPLFTNLEQTVTP